MTTAVLEQRISKLEDDLRSLLLAAPKLVGAHNSLPTGKRLRAAVKLAERDIAHGKVSGGNLRDLAR
jgi:hypothetical protein